MKITEIIVSEGTTFNHPYQSYSNYRPSITLKATLHEYDEGHEDEAIQILQQQARTMLEQDKQSILSQLEREEQERQQRWEEENELRQKEQRKDYFQKIARLPADAQCNCEHKRCEHVAVDVNRNQVEDLENAHAFSCLSCKCEQFRDIPF